MRTGVDFARAIRRRFILLFISCFAGTVAMCIIADHLIRFSFEGMEHDAYEKACDTVMIVLIALVFLWILGCFIIAYLFSARAAHAAQKNVENEFVRMDLEDERRRSFLSAVSHELKTPIALIQGYAEALQDHISENIERHDEYTAIIIDEASKMSRLVRKLTAISSFEARTDDVEPEVFELSAMIQNFLKSTDILTKQADVPVLFEETEEVYVYADPYYTEKILENYLSNAIHHVDGARIIRMTVERDLQLKKARVSLYNSGEPVPEESLPHIWEMLYKADKARTRTYDGSGIGLAIVRLIQTRMGEAYGVRNEKDGVTFWFELATAEDTE